MISLFMLINYLKAKTFESFVFTGNSLDDFKNGDFLENILTELFYYIIFVFVILIFF